MKTALVGLIRLCRYCPVFHRFPTFGPSLPDARL